MQLARETAYTIAAIAFPAIAVVSYLLSLASSWFAIRVGALDIPSSSRKLQDHPVPLFGGFGIALLGILVCIGCLMLSHSSIERVRFIGLVAGVFILLFRGILDELFNMPPVIQLAFSAVAIGIAFASGIRIDHITNPTTGTSWNLGWLMAFGFSLPADAITIVWLFLSTYAMKLLDGLDGLVSGLTVIGLSLIAMICFSNTFYQPIVALASIGVAAAYFGFLPRNWFPAKQYLGESGSTIAGFLLGALAILSSSKIATSLAVLAVPIADVNFVLLGRIARGAKWYEGDATHLHHQLVNVGLGRRDVVILYWIVSLIAGASVLFLQTRGKFFVVATLIALAGAASIALRKKMRA